MAGAYVYCGTGSTLAYSEGASRTRRAVKNDIYTMPATARHHRHIRARQLITETWQSQANLSIFLALLVIAGFILPSLGFGRSDLRLYSDVVFTLMLISGVAIGWGQRILFPIAAAIAVVTIAVRWFDFRHPTIATELWTDSCSLTSVVVISVILLWQVFREGPVTSARIQGAIAVYLLFGVGWAHTYHIVATLQPGSFNHPPGEMVSVADWDYFSYVTLTTVGYGDITPVSVVARNIAIVEALTGQLYLAVMIARLVAMEVINWQETSSRRSEQ